MLAFSIEEVIDDPDVGLYAVCYMMYSQCAPGSVLVELRSFFYRYF